MEWDILFDGEKIKEKQIELISVIGDLYNAMKEYETECNYMQSFWKGVAAEQFFGRQKSIWENIGKCGEKSRKLLLALQDAEEAFAKGEREVEMIMEENTLWKS